MHACRIRSDSFFPLLRIMKSNIFFLHTYANKFGMCSHSFNSFKSKLIFEMSPLSYLLTRFVHLELFKDKGICWSCMYANPIHSDSRFVKFNEESCHIFTEIYCKVCHKGALGILLFLTRS